MLTVLEGNCKLTFPPPFHVTNKRYTIDEELGAIDVFHNFPFLDKALAREPGTQTASHTSFLDIFWSSQIPFTRSSTPAI